MTIINGNFNKRVQPQPYKRCKACGQVMRDIPSDDPVRDAVLEVLAQANRYLPMSVLLGLVGMDISRQNLWVRCSRLEKEGRIYRDPKHPRKGWHYNYHHEAKLAA